MKIKQSEIFNQTSNREDIVKIINEYGTSEFDGAQIAAQYIVLAAEYNKNHSSEELEAQYEILETAGAKMNFEDVMFEANKIISE